MACAICSTDICFDVLIHSSPALVGRRWCDEDLSIVTIFHLDYEQALNILPDEGARPQQLGTRVFPIYLPSRCT